MLAYLTKSARQRQTLSSFDYQWRSLPEGDAMLSDAWFDEHVCEIVSELTGLAPEWFRGKTVLDAGCGSGRWSVGLLRLGALVTAVDYSEAGLERTRASCGAHGRVETMRVNLLEPPQELLERRFDMVFSYGVLHHTGDTYAALRNVARLVAENGVLFLYLYGVDSWSLGRRLHTDWLRLRLAGLSFEEKVAALRRMYPERDPHQNFDLLSPTINDRLTFGRVRAELEALGLTNVTRTIVSGEICLRAQRAGFADSAALLPGGVPGPKSLYWGHLSTVERNRRDGVYERRFWRLASEVLDGRRPDSRVEGMLERLGLSIEELRGKAVLVADPDSEASGRALASAGARVTRLSPAGGGAGQLPVLAGGTLDEPSESDPRFDFVVALGSAVAISRQPELAVRRLASRLASGGRLVVETLAPEASTTAHAIRRIALKPFSFEMKVRRLLERNPEGGLAGAFALLAAGLPPRHSEEQLAGILRAAGLEVVSVARDGANVLALARRSERVAPCAG